MAGQPRSLSDKVNPQTPALLSLANLHTCELPQDSGGDKNGCSPYMTLQRLSGEEGAQI